MHSQPYKETLPNDKGRTETGTSGGLPAASEAGMSARARPPFSYQEKTETASRQRLACSKPRGHIRFYRYMFVVVKHAQQKTCRGCHIAVCDWAALSTPTGGESTLAV